MRAMYDGRRRRRCSACRRPTTRCGRRGATSTASPYDRFWWRRAPTAADGAVGVAAEDGRRRGGGERRLPAAAALRASAVDFDGLVDCPVRAATRLTLGACGRPVGDIYSPPTVLPPAATPIPIMRWRSRLRSSSPASARTSTPVAQLQPRERDSSCALPFGGCCRRRRPPARPSARSRRAFHRRKLDPLVLSQLTRRAPRAPPARQRDERARAAASLRACATPDERAARCGAAPAASAQADAARAAAGVQRPAVRRVYKAIDWSRRSCAPTARSDGAACPAGASRPAVSELSAPLFVAAEASRAPDDGGARRTAAHGRRPSRRWCRRSRSTSRIRRSRRRAATARAPSSAPARARWRPRRGDRRARRGDPRQRRAGRRLRGGGGRADDVARSNSEKPFVSSADLEVPELQVAICPWGGIGSSAPGLLGQVRRQPQGRDFDARVPCSVFYNELWSLLGRPRDKQAPSTGLLAIALALGVCGSVSLYGFGHAGAKAGKQPCRHYWECVQWEDAASYYDPLHQFHDWLAEERLRTLWLRIGLLRDGAPPAAAKSRRAPRRCARRRRRRPTAATARRRRGGQLRCGASGPPTSRRSRTGQMRAAASGVKAGLATSPPTSPSRAGAERGRPLDEGSEDCGAAAGARREGARARRAGAAGALKLSST